MLKIVNRIPSKKREEKKIQEQRALEMLLHGVILKPITLTDKVYSIVKKEGLCHSKNIM